MGMGTSFFPEPGMDLRRSEEGDAHWRTEMHSLTKAAIAAAVDSGVRLFDLSHLYQNCLAVAEALHEAMTRGRVQRHELCLCMKLMANTDGSNLRGLAESALHAMRLDKFDLVLLYLPPAEPANTMLVWRAMEALVHSGLARSLGLSNHYEPARIAPLLRSAIPPVLNQIELHPMQQNRDVATFCTAHGVRIMAHSPLGAPNKVAYLSAAACDPRIGEQFTLVRHATVQAIATRHAITAAQVLLRWSLQKGYVPIPKSYDTSHVRENAAVAAKPFTLHASEIAALDGLHHADVNVCKFFHAANSIKAQHQQKPQPQPQPQPQSKLQKQVPAWAPAHARSNAALPAASARVAALQAEFGMAGRSPPLPASHRWSQRQLRRWFADGGIVTTAAAEAAGDEAEYRSLIDLIGVGLPVRELEPPTAVGAGGLLRAAARGDAAVFDRVADCLARDGWVLADLGVPAGHGVWRAVCDEGRQLLPQMGAGILESADGTVTKGKAPSGAARGDVYLAASHAHRLGTWPALALLDSAIAVVGHALAPAVERHPRLGHRIRLRTDPFFKVFPGSEAAPNPGYPAHYDGGQVPAATKLTAVLYCNESWRDEDGGQLRILDERGGCWRSVAPHAGRIILFLVADCLHKVEPSTRTRFTLTNWWMQPNYKPGEPTDRSVTVRSAFESGPQRYEAHDEAAKTKVLAALNAFER